MFYKAIGTEGKNVDYSQEVPVYEIILKDRIVKLPVFYFGFWKSFKENEGEYVDIARKSFIEYTGLEEKIFNESIEILLSEGVLVATKNR